MSYRTMKYVIVTGGVLSGLGKGVTASSLGVVLKGCGLRVTSIKIDPYLNNDAGTMSPFEHGEVFVLDDGGEVDLDLGNYERFLDVTLNRDNNITTGKIYQSVIDKERRGDFLGKTVQLVPHITNAIQDWIEKMAKVPVDGRDGEPDVCVIELGGTVGDIESMPFFEAISQFHDRVENICLVHVSLVPVIGVVGEQKTKPTQHSVRELRALGLTPHLVVCRSAKVSTSRPLVPYCCGRMYIPRHQKENSLLMPKIGLQTFLTSTMFPTVGTSHFFCYEIPRPKFGEWAKMAEECDKLTIPVKIAMVGKYTGLSDSYLSVIKALLHASNAALRKLVLQWVAATDLEDSLKDESPEVHAAAWAALKKSDGRLVPGGFGDRGVQGKILAAKYARESGVPFLGICLGLQIAVIEFARSVLGLEEANSREFDQATPHPCVVFMPEVSKTHMGEMMRLGSRRTFLSTADITAKLILGTMGLPVIWLWVPVLKGQGLKRIICAGIDMLNILMKDRHRYEVNPDMVAKLEAAGLRFVGKDETGRCMEIMEYPGHPYYIAVQFHPEFKSRPVKPSAVFPGLVMAASGQLDAYLRNGGNLEAAASRHVNSAANDPMKAAANGLVDSGANGHVQAAANGRTDNPLNRSARASANGVAVYQYADGHGAHQ